MGPGEALDRAVLLYYVYVGYLQMAHVAPDVITDGARQRHLNLVFDTLIAGKAPAKAARVRAGDPHPAHATLDSQDDPRARPDLVVYLSSGACEHDWHC